MHPKFKFGNVPAGAGFVAGTAAVDTARVNKLLITLLRVAGTPEAEFLRYVVRMQSIWRGAVTRKRIKPHLTRHLSVVEKQDKVETLMENRQGALEAKEEMPKGAPMGLQRSLHTEHPYEFEVNKANPFLPWSIKRKQELKGAVPAGNAAATGVGFKDSSAHESIANERRALEEAIKKLGETLETKSMHKSTKSSFQPQKATGELTAVQKKAQLEKAQAEAAAKQRALQRTAPQWHNRTTSSATLGDDQLFTRGVETVELPDVDLSTTKAHVDMQKSGNLMSKEEFNWASHTRAGGGDAGAAIPWGTMRRPFGGKVDSERGRRLKEVVEILASKAHFKFRNVRDAFRLVDVDKSGLVNRQEMHIFVRQFNLPVQYADLLFDAIDVDNNGHIDYVEFMEHFGPVIQPGCQPFHTYRSPLSKAGQRMFEPNAVGWSLRKLG